MLNTATVKSLSLINSRRSAFAIIAEWAITLGPLIFLYHYWSWFLFVIMIFWIGARQHALAILMHEGTHYRLCHDKLINDICSELFLAYPLLISTFTYRKNHLAHHRNLNTVHDPDWAAKMQDDRYQHEWIFPQSKASLLKILFKDFFGNYVLHILTRLTKHGQSPDTQRTTQGTYRIFPYLKLSFYVTIVITLSYFHLWQFFILCWILPLLTWASVVLKIRSIAEHFNLEHLPLEKRTRTTIATPWEKLFIASHNIGYHTAHHLYPSIPYYNLPKAHKLLQKNGHPMQVSYSYLKVLKECVRAYPENRKRSLNQD